ncbi:MAG: YqgE/AlgH family protein [Rhizobiales bacterium]|nr:YqgE/AlgH family protein [Hyphomicrobiales bacterium]
MISKEHDNGFLCGQMLMAMPNMEDPRFLRSVIYICAHSDEGAMGIIVNRRSEGIEFEELLEQLGLNNDENQISVPSHKSPPPILIGGPVEPGRGFVLHSNDYFAKENTLVIDGGICLTATLDILKAIASGNGPDESLLALGYAGWAAGQLEDEIQANGWLNCDADPELVFGVDLDKKYDAALEKLGVSPGQLTSDAGHA